MRRTLMAAAAALLMTGPAFAERAVCGRVDDIANRMATAYGETTAATAVTSGGAAMVVLANPDAGSFTLLFIAPSQPDVGCIFAVGNGWTVTPPGTPS